MPSQVSRNRVVFPGSERTKSISMPGASSRHGRRISFTGIEAAEGHFFYTPPYTVHDLVALEPSEILIWSDGPLDFHLSDADDGTCDDRASHGAGAG